MNTVAANRTSPVQHRDEKNRVFFPSLNGLRFIAAFAVFIFHIEWRKYYVLHHSNFFRSVEQLGPQGVHLFFVLSSFLLTYILLLETARTGTVRIKQFYIRRALRIWPLYYLIVLVAFGLLPVVAAFALPRTDTQELASSAPFAVPALVLFLTMLPNLALQIFPHLVGVHHLWSLGVEEQFYLCWPILVKTFRNRPVALVIVFACAISMTSIIATRIDPISAHWPPVCIQAVIFVRGLSNNLAFMLIGAGAAVLFMLKPALISRYLYNSFVRTALCVGIVSCLSIAFPGRNVLLQLLFATAVLSLTDPTVKFLSAKPVVYLGTISYGIYMYHPLVMTVLARLGESLSEQMLNVVMYVCALPITIAISAISYEFYERKLLRLKHKHAVVESGQQTSTP